MNAIAKAYGTYATTVKRVLEQNEVELRHDIKREGTLYVQDGEKLIEWAKAQGRLVTKAELAAVAGTKRLSPSYFEKYPELGNYVKTNSQKEIDLYINQLYAWLQENNIPYKPKDRKKLKVSVDALLLGDYTGIAIQTAIKPYNVSKQQYDDNMVKKAERANENGIFLVFLDKDHFKNLDETKPLLDKLMKVRRA